MRKLISAAVISVFLAQVGIAGYAQAADQAKKPTAQQEKMADCNKEASGKGLKGDERKEFMSSCLKKDKKTAQQEKMTACNKQASDKALKGDERKKFMSSCLKG